MTEAIFLDAGGVILDETASEVARASLICGLLAVHLDYSQADYWRDTAEAVQDHVSSVYEYALFKHLHSRGLYPAAMARYRSEWQALGQPLVLMAGLPEMLARLSGSYRLGILGQYGQALLETLEAAGLLGHFAFQDTQEDHTLTKPDPRYYLAVLANAGAVPQRSLMIGDRIDKDIYPANVVGMRSIRMRTGLHAAQEARLAIELPDATVDRLADITPDLVARIDAHPGFQNPFFS